jgi:hypothetical protein
MLGKLLWRKGAPPSRPAPPSRHRRARLPPMSLAPPLLSSLSPRSTARVPAWPREDDGPVSIDPDRGVAWAKWPCWPCTGLAHPGPLSLSIFFFFFPSATWNSLLGRPTLLFRYGLGTFPAHFKF